MPPHTFHMKLLELSHVIIGISTWLLELSHVRHLCALGGRSWQIKKWKQHRGIYRSTTKCRGECIRDVIYLFLYFYCIYFHCNFTYPKFKYFHFLFFNLLKCHNWNLSCCICIWAGNCNLFRHSTTNTAHEGWKNLGRYVESCSGYIFGLKC